MIQSYLSDISFIITSNRLGKRSVNCGLCTKTDPHLIFVNKILLKHSHICLYTIKDSFGAKIPEQSGSKLDDKVHMTNWTFTESLQKYYSVVSIKELLINKRIHKINISNI